MRKKRDGLPNTNSHVRHFIPRRRANGTWSYYWQVPERLRKAPGRPSWLRSQPLKDDQGRWLPLSKAMAKAQQLNARLDEWRGGARDHAGEMAALLARWMESPDFKKLAPRTQQDYAKHVKALSAGPDPKAPGLGDSAAEEVTPETVQLYVDWLQESTTLGAVQIRHRVSVLRKFWSWARKRGLVTGENPAVKMGLKASPPKQTVWPIEKLRALCQKPYPVGTAALLALYTAQRQGDILDMRWDDYDVEAGTLRVVQNKTGKRLLLPACPRLREVLAATSRRGETILANRLGQPYTENGFRTLLQRSCAKLRPCPDFHSIRRTCATWLQRDGLSDEIVALWTGHAREGGGRMLDVYIVKQRDMAEKAHPVMQAWGV